MIGMFAQMYSWKIRAECVCVSGFNCNVKVRRSSVSTICSNRFAAIDDVLLATTRHATALQVADLHPDPEPHLLVWV